MQNQNIDHKATEPELKRERGGHGRNLPPFRKSDDYTDDFIKGGQRRVKPRAVDIKRAQRAAKKAGGVK